MAEETKKNKTAKPKKKDGRGGKREGAGRKSGVGVTYESKEPLDEQVTMRVRAITKSRVVKLREATRDDDVPFNRMFEDWVADYAKQYGIE